MIVISKTIGRLIAAAVLTVTASTSAVSETVEISYQSLGTSTTLDLPTKIGSVPAGLIEVTADGHTTAALNTTQSDSNASWSAQVNTFLDIQNGAGKYNRGKNDEKKYAKAGYLFSLLDFSDTLSETAAQYNALINYVIWEIMGQGGDKQSTHRLKTQASSNRDYEWLKTHAKQNKDFDWSSTMVVYTESGTRNQEFFAPLPPIATPIPSALFLFGSMALGLLGILTRKRIR